VIEAVRAAGGTRLSIGVQSLDDDELSRLGRIHSAVDAATAYVPPWRAGSRSHATSCVPRPAQTGSSWERTLRETVLLGVGHISVYPLMIEEGTALSVRVGGGSPAWNDETSKRRACSRRRSSSRVPASFAMMVRKLCETGEGLQHNITYWTGGTYLGPGNISLQYAFGEGYLILSKACPQLPPPPDGSVRVRLTCTSSRRVVASGEGLGQMSYDLSFSRLGRHLRKTSCSGRD